MSMTSAPSLDQAIDVASRIVDRAKRTAVAEAVRGDVDDPDDARTQQRER